MGRELRLGKRERELIIISSIVGAIASKSVDFFYDFLVKAFYISVPRPQELSLLGIIGALIWLIYFLVSVILATYISVLIVTLFTKNLLRENE